MTMKGVSKKQILALNVLSAIQAPLAATGCSVSRPYAIRPFFQAR